jgi:hypothetical protein
MRRRPFLMLVLGAMMLDACTIEQPLPKRWTKADTTRETFMQDRYACYQEQQGASGAHDGHSLAACMVARGYTEDPDGALFAPTEGPTITFSPTIAPALQTVQKSVNALSPQFAARQRYERSAAEYQNCLAATRANESACEGQRAAMEADQKGLSDSSK